MKRKKNILEKTETVNEKQIDSIFYRLILVGDTMVGKTQIINRYINDLFQEEYFPTFSIDFKIKTQKINGRTINIHCIDTEGSSEFYIDTGTLFIQKADAFIYVFDISSRESFNNLNIIRNKIKSTLYNLEKIISEKIVYLVGNKCDLGMYRQINETEGRLEANKYNAKYVEVSAKNGMNVDKLFDFIIQDIIKKKENKINFDGGGGIKNKSIYNNKINNFNDINNNIDVKINNENNIDNNNNLYGNENGLDYDNSSYFLKSKIQGSDNNNNNDYVKNINNFYINNKNEEDQNKNFFPKNTSNKCQIF